MVILFVTLLLLLTQPIIASAELTYTRWIDWDNIPINQESELPKDGVLDQSHLWKYSSIDHNTGRDFFGSAGWFNTDPDQTTVDEEAWYIQSPTSYNDYHMGYGSFGYLDIVNDFCMSGNCVRYITTGSFSRTDDGSNEDRCGEYGTGGECQQYGTFYMDKTQYMALTEDPTYKGPHDYQLGRFKWYVGNGDISYHQPLPITTAAHNRLSFYLYLSGDANVTQMPQEGIPQETVSYVAPFNNIGGHWYHYGLQCLTGGWIHFYVDEHPSYNNSWGSMVDAPLPHGAVRTFRSQYPDAGGYWEKMYLMYSSSGKINEPPEINGLALPNNLPAAQYMDEFAFVVDPEPQNEETINGMATTYIYDTQYFWIGFYGKYNSACNINYETFEIRYRIGSEITNANFDSSTLVDMDPAPEFYSLTSPAEGVITSNTSCKNGIMARFKVKPADQSLLHQGVTIWFGIKDVSQDPNDDHLPNPAQGYNGRNYNAYPDLDYEYDHPAMQLIKRTPYTLGPEYPTTAGPMRSSGQPTGQQPAGITQVTMSLTTAENATCRYSTIAGTDYASMTDTFSTTGGTSHSQLITGLIDGQSYTYYVRCSGTEVNDTDYAISWSVAAAGESTAFNCGAVPIMQVH